MEQNVLVAGYLGNAGGRVRSGCILRCRPGQLNLSENIGDDFLLVVLGAGIANVAGACSADFVGDEAVLGRVDGAEQLVPEAVEHIGLEATFEDGILDTEAVVFANGGDLPEAAIVGDIVSDDG